MTELERRIVSAGDHYNRLMASVPRATVSLYRRERISRIQRRIARHHLLLRPRQLSAETLLAHAQPDMYVELDKLPLDAEAVIDQCIAFGEVYADLFEQLVPEGVSAHFNAELDRVVEENDAAFNQIVGFETFDANADTPHHPADNPVLPPRVIGRRFSL